MATRRLWTVALVVSLAWAGTWLWIGLRVAEEVRGLRELSDTLVDVGQAVRTSGETIEGLSEVPLVGGRLREPAGRIKKAGRSAIESGRTSRESVRNLSVLLGVSIAVIPSVPLAMAAVLLWHRRRPRERPRGPSREASRRSS